MAGGTLVVLEEGVAFYLLCRQSLLVTLEVEVEGTVGGEKGLLIFCNGIGDGLLVQTFGIDGQELGGKLLIGCQFGCNLVKGGRTHLHGVQWRTCGLVGQRGCTSVPELYEVEGCIVGGRGVDATHLTCYTLGILLVIYTRSLDTVTGGARHRVVA